MTSSMGVDGCRDGWFYFSYECGKPIYGVAKSIQQLFSLIDPKAVVYIDILIGLIDEGAGGRRCDSEARSALGHGRASSVFSAPARPTLSAGSYAEAKQLNQAATGKMISQQAFAIIPKIREVDDFLRERPEIRYRLREVHPEVCFWGLNQELPMEFAKKKREGFEERLGVLERYLPDVRSITESILAVYPRKAVARDDILDAIVGYLVGIMPEGRRKTLPSEPLIDSAGLPMEMVYAGNF